MISEQLPRDSARISTEIAGRRAGGTGPGGHVGATLQSSAADPIPMAGTSDKSLTGPAEPSLDTALAASIYPTRARNADKAPDQ
jgi:hypothetical protein